MACVSFRRSPLAPEAFSRSLPARSIKFSTPAHAHQASQAHTPTTSHLLMHHHLRTRLSTLPHASQTSHAPTAGAELRKVCTDWHFIGLCAAEAASGMQSCASKCPRKAPEEGLRQPERQKSTVQHMTFASRTTSTISMPDMLQVTDPRLLAPFWAPLRHRSRDVDAHH